MLDRRRLHPMDGGARTWGGQKAVVSGASCWCGPVLFGLAAFATRPRWIEQSITYSLLTRGGPKDDALRCRLLHILATVRAVAGKGNSSDGLEDLPKRVLTVACGFRLAGKESESSSAVRSTLGAQEHVSGVVACVQAAGEVVQVGHQEHFDAAVDHRVDDLQGDL